MKIPVSRRNVIVAACLMGVAASGSTIWAVSSEAAPLSFKVPLTGAQQVPPVQTAASGSADLSYDPATRMLTWSVAYNGLSGAATMAHIHGPGGGRQERSADDLAEREGRGRRQSDHRERHGHAGAGAANDGRRVVHQRAHPG